MVRTFHLFIVLVGLLWAPAVQADVQLSFHSFNGSIFFGRYPHTFVVLEGELDDGTPIAENYGFSAKRATPAVLRGPVEHMILVEDAKWIGKTNRHFTVTIDDAKYWALRKEVDRWRDAPGRFYDLGTRNCIHFVGTIAKIVGVRVDYPKNMLRRPKSWLNHIVERNPEVKGTQF